MRQYLTMNKISILSFSFVFNYHVSYYKIIHDQNSCKILTKYPSSPLYPHTRVPVYPRFMLTVFTRKHFEEIRRFIHFTSLPYDVMSDMYDVTVIPYTRLVILLIIYIILKNYGLHNHRFLLTKPWYFLKADSESNS